MGRENDSVVARGVGAAVEGIAAAKVFTSVDGLTGEVRVGTLATETAEDVIERWVPSEPEEIGLSFLGWGVSGLSA